VVLTSNEERRLGDPARSGASLARALDGSRQ